MRGIEFGNILGAAGVQGFWGEGYWYHRYLKLFGLLNFAGMTFVSKTSTLSMRAGNMPLRADQTPVERFPKCVCIKPWSGMALNAVGLSGPGLGVLLRDGRWQEMTSPFLISLMSVSQMAQDRISDYKIMTNMIRNARSGFKAPFALQINLSCPNTSHDPKHLLAEMDRILEEVGELGVPIMPKFSIASADVNAVAKLQDNPICDAICVSNTIPFGWPELNWKKVWGSDVSPLAKFGGTGGGLSGEPLRALTCAWIRNLRKAGFKKPINGGGGILHPKHVHEYREAGATSVFLGVIASLRPWQVQPCIREANGLNWR